ncbi:sensor histidine kinase [Georgenia sp. MJ173]|uniref:sensor histidine kinase n=1 Tax=Georgenia sunbinii TaxID=3117728 RepID=UPI002F26A7EA
MDPRTVPPAPRLGGVDSWLRRRPWLTDAVLAAALAAVLAPASLGPLLAGGPTAPWLLPAIAAIVVAHLAVALRRTKPAAAYATGAAAMLVLVLVPVTVTTNGAVVGPFPAILLPSALVFPVLLYSAAAYARPPWPTLALAVGLLGAVITAVPLWTGPDWVSPALGGPAAVDTTELLPRAMVLGALLAVVLAGWGLGRFRGVRAAYLGQLEERTREAQAREARQVAQAAAEERTRVAREMHDIVAHSLAVIVRQAEGGRLAGEHDPAVALRTLDTVAETGRDALDDTRTVLGRLRSDGTDTDGEQRGDPAVEDIPALVERVRATGLPVDLVVTGTPVRLSPTARLAAYRVAQEALTNVVKHAGDGARACVGLAWAADSLTVTVEDAGGSPPPPGESGLGLLGMRERVDLEGGELVARPRDDGFVVRASIPSGRSGTRRRPEDDEKRA